MNIKEQTQEAKKFTDQLLKLIVNKNKYTLNKDGLGCYITGIYIQEMTDHTELEVTFRSANAVDSPVTSFTCNSTLY